MELFPNCLLQSAASLDADHCPLILGLHDHLPGKGRFHFESFWPQLDGFQDVVAQAWGSVEIRFCPLETLSLKFKSLTRALQSWSQKCIGQIRSQFALAKEIIHQLEIAQDSSLTGNYGCCILKKHSLAPSSLQKTITRTRSRIGWLKDGDANTALFHMILRNISNPISNPTPNRTGRIGPQSSRLLMIVSLVVMVKYYLTKMNKVPDP